MLKRLANDAELPLSQTVHTFLAERGSEALLEDPLVPVATREILADGKPRPTVQREIKEKEKARDAVARKYCHGRLSEDEIRHCMYSIGDNRCVLRQHRAARAYRTAFSRRCWLDRGGVGWQLGHTSREYAFGLHDPMCCRANSSESNKARCVNAARTSDSTGTPWIR